MAYRIIKDTVYSDIITEADKRIDNIEVFKSLKGAKSELIKYLQAQIFELEEAADRVNALTANDLK